MQVERIEPPPRVNLAESELDARLVLSPAVGQTSGTPPEITVMLKGPISAPKRSVDVAVFAIGLRCARSNSSRRSSMCWRREPAAADRGRESAHVRQRPRAG
jgi:hypothetical protein